MNKPPLDRRPLPRKDKTAGCSDLLCHPLLGDTGKSVSALPTLAGRRDAKPGVPLGPRVLLASDGIPRQRLWLLASGALGFRLGGSCLARGGGYFQAVIRSLKAFSMTKVKYSRSPGMAGDEANSAVDFSTGFALSLHSSYPPVRPVIQPASGIPSHGAIG